MAKHSLQDILATLNYYYPDVVIEDITKYRGKLILIDASGSCYVPNIRGGIDHLGGLTATQMHIDALPQEYPTLGRQT